MKFAPETQNVLVGNIKDVTGRPTVVNFMARTSITDT